MQILTWNINGIRACKQPLKGELSDLESDIICLQETKITRDLLDEETAIQDGYNSFFSFSKRKSGYSGVATYCKVHATPVHAEEGLSGILHDRNKCDDLIGYYGDLSDFTDEELLSLDSEGRAILTEHQYRDSSGELTELVVINVYCPRADPDREGRLDYKLNFYKLLQIRAEALLQAKKHVIILGDFNVSHKPIDHCDPDGDDVKHSYKDPWWLRLRDINGSSIILQQGGGDSSVIQLLWEKFYARPSRQWLEQLLEDVPSNNPKKKQSSQQGSKKFIDTFRYFYPHRESAFTCWSTKTGARQTNYGTRIDYIVSDTRLCKQDFEECEILQDFEGSDHCPVRACLKGAVVVCDRIPSSCTKFMPEFLGGRQQKLSSFFTKGTTTKDKNNCTLSIGTERTNCDQQESGTVSDPLSTSGKRHLETSSMEPSSKKAKSMKAPTKSKKTSSITNFFKKVPSVPSAEPKEVDKTEAVERLTQLKNESDSCPSHQLIQDGDKPDNRTDFENGSNQAPVLKTESSGNETKTKKRMVSSWKDILKGPPPAPLCKGHKEPCLLRTVKKPGPNLGKQFYVCCRPEGHKNNPDARCGHFEWVGPVLKKPREIKNEKVISQS